MQDAGIMQERGEHCPFLNRSDERCAEYLNLDHLGHALEHCFDNYQACQVYSALLSERQDRRGQSAVETRLRPSMFKGRRNAHSHLVQVQVASRYAKQSV
jgi:hypothetical protein